MLEQRKNVRRKEQQRQCVMNGPQPHSPSFCATQEEELENSGVKLSLRNLEGRTEEWGEDVFILWLCFSLSYSNLIGDKLN